ncbi:hypothetical protein QOZ80_5BG0412240 [Eleusine coracana subsp. coracana]|nr:hypothetical protein QOZ80_5BG0412240 [Eleusine coracana subsp. coracana]
MESSPAATMAPPPSSSSRSRDPLLFGSFDLPSGWGCRKPMAFCRDIDAHHVVPEPAPNAALPIQNKGLRSPAKGAAAEEAPEAPRRQWNLRDRTTWRDYRAEDARPLKKLIGNAEADGATTRGFSASLTRQEIEADFVAITGRKPPRKPKKRPKAVQRQIENLYPGSSLAEVTRDRYKVNEKGGF